MTRYRRRSEDDDSSLELLLDTMCNTFGGVMFIAISVFVIILGMTQSDTSRKETVSPEELRRNIAQMQNVIAEAVRQLQIDADELKIRLKEHDSTLLNEIAQLEVLIKELEIKKQAIELANQSMTKTISTATENKKSNKQQLEKLTAANDAIEVELMEKIQQLKALQYQQIPAHKMVFKVMQGSQKHPFFIIMNGNKAYPPDCPAAMVRPDTLYCRS